MAFSMECHPAFNYVRNTHEAEVLDMFKSTVADWIQWLSKRTHTGRWREVVQHSASP